MKYTPEEVMQFIREEDVKFIRMAFCDVYGRQHNVAVMADELQRAFAHGVAVDASSIEGFGGDVRSDLLLYPDGSTLIQLPWRPQHGRVAHMFCNIRCPDGTPFAGDTRRVLQDAVAAADAAGYSFPFSAEMEFYLFKLNENGARTMEPYDEAGYMDIAPEDKGENVRREICLTLEEMGICPESSHHESGPGQNEIGFRYSDPLHAADNAVTFHAVVRTIAARNGLWADFSPRPLPQAPGNGMHINFSVQGGSGGDPMPSVIAGILEQIGGMTLFLNPRSESYDRLGRDKAPAYVSWARENRSQLIRIPVQRGADYRAELRSPDSLANPYLAYALLIYAGLDGIQRGLKPPESMECNLFNALPEQLAGLQRLPASLEEAVAAASESAFIRKSLPPEIVSAYCGGQAAGR